MPKYFSPDNGNNSNNGLTPDTPKKDFGAFTQVIGDVFYGMGGESSGDVISLTQNNITLGSYGIGKHIIAGPERAINTSANTGIILQDLHLTSATTHTITANAGAGNGTTNLNLIIRRVLISSSATIGIWMLGSGLSVIECIIHDVGDDGVWCEGNNLRVINSNIYNIDTASLGGDCIQQTVYNDNAFIVGNILDATNADVKQSIILNGVGANGIIRNNIITCSTVSAAIEIDQTHTGVLIEQNIIRGGRYCINATGDDAIIRANILIDGDLGGIQSANATGTIVYNNVITGCPDGLSFGNDGFGTGDATAYNNIIFESTGDFITKGTGFTLVSDNNLFYNSDSSARFYDNSTLYTSLSAWQALTFDANSLNSDPLFTDSAREDYRVESNSPCVSAGKSLSITDLLELPFSELNHDIGAYSFRPEYFSNPALLNADFFPAGLKNS